MDKRLLRPVVWLQRLIEAAAGDAWMGPGRRVPWRWRGKLSDMRIFGYENS
jgi:hypothetical protein